MSGYIVARRAPLSDPHMSTADFWVLVDQQMGVLMANVGFGGPDPTGEDFPYRLR